MTIDQIDARQEELQKQFNDLDAESTQLRERLQTIEDEKLRLQGAFRELSDAKTKLQSTDEANTVTAIPQEGKKDGRSPKK